MIGAKRNQVWCVCKAGTQADTTMCLHDNKPHACMQDGEVLCSRVSTSAVGDKSGDATRRGGDFHGTELSVPLGSPPIVDYRPDG